MQIGRSMCAILGTKTSAPGLWQEVKEINLKDNIVCILWWHDFICLQNSAGNKMDIQLKSSYILDMHAKSRERESERWVLGHLKFWLLGIRADSRWPSSPTLLLPQQRLPGRPLGEARHTLTLLETEFSDQCLRISFANGIFWIFFNPAHVAFLISWPLVITAVLTGTAAILLCRSVGYKGELQILLCGFCP